MKTAYIKTIDYCIKKFDDLCGKCIYAKKYEEDVEVGCEYFDKDGNVACRNGIIKYFEGEERSAKSRRSLSSIQSNVHE